MKKILTLMLATLAVFALRANDADDVKATLNKINQLSCELKISETLPYYAPEYTGISARGKKVTYADAERIAKNIERLVTVPYMSAPVSPCAAAMSSGIM